MLLAGRTLSLSENAQLSRSFDFYSFIPATFRPHPIYMRPPRMDTAQLVLVHHPFDHPDFIFRIEA
jgi:hypothetical protein